MLGCKQTRVHEACVERSAGPLLRWQWGARSNGGDTVGRAEALYAAGYRPGLSAVPSSQAGPSTASGSILTPAQPHRAWVDLRLSLTGLAANVQIPL